MVNYHEANEPGTVRNQSELRDLFSLISREHPAAPMSAADAKERLKPVNVLLAVAFILVLFSFVSAVAQQSGIKVESREPAQSNNPQPDAPSGNINQPAGTTRDGKAQDGNPATVQPSPIATHLAFHWRPALLQSVLLLSVQRGFDVMTETDTRVNLRGPFFKDYFRSLGNMHGWRDGDPTRTNYLAHPFQGAITGFIEIGNDPKDIHQKFQWHRRYWKSRLKAMGWAAAYSTYFEIGPGISEAMIGNVGLPAEYRAPGSKPRPSNGGMGFVDMVVTPTIGTGWLISEDIIDRYVIARLEKHVGPGWLRDTVRVLLNPARSSAQVLRVEKPWHRDTRGRAMLRSGSQSTGEASGPGVGRSH